MIFLFHSFILICIHLIFLGHDAHYYQSCAHLCVDVSKVSVKIPAWVANLIGRQVGNTQNQSENGA